jgi:hypothetical protein
VIEPPSASTGGTVLLRAIATGSVGVIATCDRASGRGSVRVSAPVVVPPVAAPPVAAPPVRQEHPPAPPPSATVVMKPAERPSEWPAERSAAPPPRATSGPVARSVDESAAAPPAAPAAPTVKPPATLPPAVTREHSSRKPRAWLWAVPATAVAAGVVAYLALRPAAPSTTVGDSTVVRPPDSVIARTDSTPVSKPLGGAADSTPAGQIDSANAPRADTPVTRDPIVAPVARRIELRPARPAAIRPGETIALSATVRDASGAPMADARVTWSSADPRIATVDPSRGVVRAVAAGATRITARAGNITSAVSMSVVPPAPDPAVVASVEMADVRSLTVGETARLSARALNGAGAPATGAVIDWSSSNADVASVASDGVLTARGAGTAVVRASAGGRSTERSVTIRAREVVTRPDSPVTRPPTATPKSDSELRAEIRGVLATYARAIQTRDTSLIRRVFPTARDAFMSRWQGTFKEAVGPIQVTTGNIEVLDAPRDAPGAEVRVRYSGRLAFRVGRDDQDGPYTFTATLQRDGATWKITSLR